MQLFVIIALSIDGIKYSSYCKLKEGVFDLTLNLRNNKTYR